jgi:hypothetical protein
MLHLEFESDYMMKYLCLQAGNSLYAQFKFRNIQIFT